MGNVNTEHFQRANNANKRRASLLRDSSSGQSIPMCEHGKEPGSLMTASLVVPGRSNRVLSEFEAEIS